MQVENEAVYKILNAENFSDSSIDTTVKFISANPEKFYLISPDTGLRLHEAIDKLSKRFSDKAELTGIRFAMEINFALKVSLQIGSKLDGGLDVKTFSELLSFLKYDDSMNLARNDFHVIVDDTDCDNSDERAGRAVAEIFQQMIYLRLNIDVKKKSEIRKSLIKDRFRAKYQEMRTEVDQIKTELDAVIKSGKMHKAGNERVQRMIDAINKMLDAFDDGRKRPIRIAVMGTKKAGKSIIINSILKRDYAPTSSELPTPNVIKYVPEREDSALILEYQGNEQIFDTSEALKNYIESEFEIAQKHTNEGSGLENMIIHYPSEEFSGYEVWDTPGPNFAGAGDEHRKIAENCIESADICIFIVNYSNHLTDDEEKFLRQIHEVFKRNNKFYSLFVAVNRIDERYSSEVEKSVSRLVDYIRSRFEELGYKNIIFFGTSALQSFYLDKVLELVGDNIDDYDSLEDCIKAFKKTHRKFMTQLHSVETALGNLQAFHNINEPSSEDLRSSSGIPPLERYLKYVGEQKVDSEIVDNVITRCENQFDMIKNANLISKLLELSDDDRKYLVELGKLFDGLRIEVKKTVDGIQSRVSDENISSARLNVVKAAQDSRREVLSNVEGMCRDVINNTPLNEDDIEQLRAGTFSDNMTEINNNIAAAMVGLNRRSAETVAAMTKSESDKFSLKVEAGIQKAREEISRKTDEVREKVKNARAQDIITAFSIPDFPPSLNKMSFEAKAFDANLDDDFLKAQAERQHRTEYETKYKTETVTKTRTATRERKSRGFWESVASFFGKKYYEDYEQEYTEQITKPYQVSKDVYNVEGFKQSILYELQNRVRNVVERAHDEIQEEAEKIVQAIYSNIRTQCYNINAEYMKLFEDFSNDIKIASDETSQHKKALEDDIAALREIDERFVPFFTMWYDIFSDQKIKN
ncbi:MAG: dynamin family protein [Synergistaceae bacterium]|nr:dynamin family protein [Synergistaceae bacterium]